MNMVQINLVPSSDLLEANRLNQLSVEQNDRNLYYITPTTYWVKQATTIAPELAVTTFDGFIRSYIKKSFCGVKEWQTKQWKLFMVGELSGTYRSKQKALDTYIQLKRFGQMDLPESLAFLKDDFKKIRKAEQTQQNGTIDDLYWYATQIKPPMPIDEVIFEGFVDFTVPQYELITFLKAQGIQCTIYLDAHMSSTIDELIKLGFIVNGTKEERENMSHYPLSSASTKEEELLGIIEHMLKRKQEPSDVAVLFSSAEERFDFKEKAHKAGLPIAGERKILLKETSLYKWINEGLFATSISRESLAADADLLFPLLGLSGRAYLQAKQSLMRTGKTGMVLVDELLAESTSFRLQTKGSFSDQVEQLLYALKLVDKIVPIAYFEQIQMYLKEEFGQLDVLKAMEKDAFYDWFETVAETIVVELEEENTGISILSWSDIGAFNGSTIYIGGMDAGSFPTPYHYLGFVVEEDLMEIKKRGLPLKENRRAAQLALFDRVLKRHQTVLTSYVIGVNSDDPASPSPFVRSFTLSEHWSFHTRLETGQSCFTLNDAQAMNAEDRVIAERLSRLESGKEPLTKSQSLTMKNREIINVTELEAYAQCPFRYGIERLLNVKKPLEFDEAFPFHLIGSAIHFIIEKLYKNYLDVIGKPFGSLSNSVKESVPSWLTNEWYKVFNEEIKPSAPYMNELELQLEYERWDKQLQNWWKAERSTFWDRDDLSEAQIESLEVPVKLEGYQLENSRVTIVGKIDRVDSVDGERVLYDYKTGKASLKMVEIQAGLKLQLPLYAYILGKETPIAGASYISFKEPKKRSSNGLWAKQHVGKGSIFAVSSQCRNTDDTVGDEQFMERWGLHKRIQSLWDGMTTDASVAPLNCPQTCPHKATCRVTEAMKKEINNAVQQ